MPNLADGDKLLFVLEYTQSNQRIINTQVLRYNSDIAGPDDYEAFCQAYCDDAVGVGGIMDQICGLTCAALQPQKASLQGVYPTRLRAKFSSAGSYTRASGAIAPVNTAAVVEKTSIVAKRYGVGSWHQAGFPLSALSSDGGSWSTTPVGNLQIALGAWFTPGRVPTGMNGNVDPVLWSIHQPTRTTFITGWLGKTSARTMHRRTLRVGE